MKSMQSAKSQRPSRIPYWPYVVMMVDMRGKLRLHAPSMDAVRIYYKRQFDASRKLGDLLGIRK